MKARNNLFRFGLAGLILVYLLFWMPLPYVVIQPGSAENLADMVNIPDGHMEQKGSFMLTTVRISYPHSNTASLLYAYLHPFAHAVPRSEFFRGETADEYSQRQEYVMATSQSNAIQVALREAGIPYEIRTTGVMVLGTVEGMQAAEVLQRGTGS